MNPNQVASLLRTILKMVGAILVTHGLTNAANIINGEDFSGVLLGIIGIVMSHYTHSDGSGANGSKTSLLALFILPALLFVGCANLSNSAFTLEQTAATTSDAAMKSYATYFDTAITNPAAFNRTQAGLIAERAQVQDTSVKIGTAIELVENLRESYATNSAVEPQLQAALTALSQNLADEISFVGSLTSTNKNK